MPAIFMIGALLTAVLVTTGGAAECHRWACHNTSRTSTNSLYPYDPVQYIPGLDRVFHRIAREVAMTKIGIKELRQHLQQRTQAELINDIVDLFRSVDAVKDYYQLRLDQSPNEQLIATYKAAIQQEFFPKRGFGEARLSIAQQPIREYKKISPSPEGLIELMVFYVEMGVRFTNTYGDINEPFYNSMERMYERAVRLIVEHHLQDRFELRCKHLVHNTANIGWGFDYRTENMS